jgi:hypothetical protein
MLKKYREDLATFFGAIAGICAVLVANGFLDAAIGGTIGGIATVLLGSISNYSSNK